jgi:hypothetical protein
VFDDSGPTHDGVCSSLAALELDLGPVVTRQDEDAYIFANLRTGKRDTPAGPMETSMWWLDIRRLSWRLHGRRSGTALIGFQRRCGHVLDRPRRREPHAREPRVLERRRERDRPVLQVRSFLRREVGPGSNGGPFNRVHHANRLVLSQGRGGACLAADYGARATGFEPVFCHGRVFAKYPAQLCDV